MLKNHHFKLKSDFFLHPCFYCWSWHATLLNILLSSSGQQSQLCHSHPPTPAYCGKSLKSLQISSRKGQNIGVLSTLSQPQIQNSTKTAALKIVNSMPATWCTHLKMWTPLYPVLWASFVSSAHCSGHAQHQTCSTTGTSSECSPLSLHRESPSLRTFFCCSLNEVPKKHRYYHN